VGGGRLVWVRLRVLDGIGLSFGVWGIRFGFRLGRCGQGVRRLAGFDLKLWDAEIPNPSTRLHVSRE
jgi:hypothetical protein